MPDHRRSQLAAWAAQQLQLPEVTLTPASADASFRRYFRIRLGHDSVIAMDAPPEQEDTGRFVLVAGLLRDAGVHAPHIPAHDTERGFALLEDLGTQTYLNVLDAGNADQLFEQALDTLVLMQAKADTSALPDYDQKLLRAELSLFPDWYLQHHLGIDLKRKQRESLEATFELLERSALSQPRVFVHRDFMPRNLMQSDPNPGVIDFQDAVRGPVSYDPLCLFKDAYNSWPETRIEEWLKIYWSKAQDAGVPVQDDWREFQRALDWMGIQRHLKVIGIFARLYHRDGKPGYLEDIPRFFAYIREVAPRYAELDEFMTLMEAWKASP